MKKSVLLLFLLSSALTSFAKSGYNIHVTAPQLANDSIYLAGYYNGKIFAFDTLALDNKGKGSFVKEKKLDEGLYLIYLSPKLHYDFIVGPEQDLQITIDTTKVGFKITGAPQTEAFIAFGEYMTQKRKEQEILKTEFNNAKGDSIKERLVNDKIKALDNEVIAYQAKLRENYKGKVLGLFINALITPQFPENLINGDLNDPEFQMARYQYAKNHYWDNVDLSDIRSWRLNFLTNKLEEYTSHILIPNPDSITPAVIELIEKSKLTDKPYTYDKLKPTAYELMVNYMINYSVTSKMMGMDKLMVALADKYYFTGQAPWADSTIMANITSEVRKVRHNLIGMKAANLPLKKLDGTNFSIYDLKNPCTLVYFYEPSCGHCKEVTPKIYDTVYKKYKSRGFEVVAVYIMTDKKEWQEFIDKHKLYDWINAWDPNRQSFYWQYFDTSTTPGVYLLDRDKKIIAKKIDVASLDKILEIELNK